MCNLNILIRKRLSDIKVTPFIQSVTSSSYVSNSHGEGFWCSNSNKVRKSDLKINYFNFENDLERSLFILTHQRFATSGRETEYHQPFIMDGFVFMHNGVINKFLGEQGSDSFGFMKSFLEEFNKNGNGDREQKIVRALKVLLDNYEMGSYSCALMDLFSNKMYYFKNSSTSIHFYKYQGMLYITTAEENKLLLPLIKGKKRVKELEIKDYIIYRIGVGKRKIYIKPLDEIERRSDIDIIYEDEQTKLFDEDKEVEEIIKSEGGENV